VSTRPKKAVIFDFDGTLVNSMEYFEEIASRVMYDVYHTPKKEAKRQYILTSGLPFREQLEEIYPGDPRNEMAAEMYENEKQRRYLEQRPYEGARETLEELRKNGFVTIISSNNFQDLVDKLVEKVAFKADLVLGLRSKDFGKGTPHFEFVLKNFGLKKDEVLFVGDSLKDAEKASSFGIPFVGKTGLFKKKDFLKKFGVDTIDDLQGLLTYLDIKRGA